MKNYLFIFFCCFSFASFSQWTNVGAGAVSSSWTTYNDIAIDTSNAPVIIFNDTPSNLSCMRFNGTQWQQVGASTFTFPFGSNYQLLVDSVNDNYYLAFYDKNNSYPSVVTYDAMSWVYAGSQYLANQIVNDFCMAYDRWSVLYCAFTSSSGLQIFKANGSSWVQVPTTGIPSPVAHISITFDRQNDLVIAFTNMNTLSANCMKFDGTSWQQMGNANFTTGGFAQYNKVKVSESNEIFVATQNVTTTCYKLNSTNVWQQLGPGGLGINCNGVDDLIIKNNVPIILTTQIAADKARCMYYNGNNWFLSCGGTVSDTTASSAAMELDQHSTIYSIYNDYVGGKAYVRKCGAITGISENVKTNSLKIYPNPVENNLTIEIEKPATLKMYNVTGDLIIEASLTEGKNTFMLSSYARGMYFVSIIDEASEKLISHQKVILIK